MSAKVRMAKLLKKAARWVAAPVVLLAMVAGAPQWQQKLAAQADFAENGAGWTSVQYAIQATRLNPYIDTF